MMVWIVQGGYRQDGEIYGVFASRDLAEADAERRREALGQHRLNPSWEISVIGMELQRAAPCDCHLYHKEGHSAGCPNTGTGQ
jgi:hypothetical protein